MFTKQEDQLIELLFSFQENPEMKMVPSFHSLRAKLQVSCVLQEKIRADHKNGQTLTSSWSTPPKKHTHQQQQMAAHISWSLVLQRVPGGHDSLPVCVCVWDVND